MVVARSNICTEFDDRTVGTKVEDVYEFTRALHEVVPQHDWSDSENGQEVITLDDHFLYPVQEVVSAGVGRTTDDPDDYVIRQYRGTPKKYLKRRCAAEAESCRAVVYTQEAYLKDPDTEAKEAERIHSLDAEYVLVTVLADTKREESPLTPGRLVRNLAGANNAVEQWTKEDIVEKAKESIEYYDNWHVVAD